MFTYCVVGFNERIIDGDDINVFVLNGISEDDTTNTAESVDANLCGSHDSMEAVRRQIEDELDQELGMDNGIRR